MTFLELRQSGHPILKGEICSRPDVNWDLTLGRGHGWGPLWEAPQRVALAQYEFSPLTFPQCPAGGPAVWHSDTFRGAAAEWDSGSESVPRFQTNLAWEFEFPDPFGSEFPELELLVRLGAVFLNACCKHRYLPRGVIFSTNSSAWVGTLWNYTITEPERRHCRHLRHQPVQPPWFT